MCLHAIQRTTFWETKSNGDLIMAGLDKELLTTSETAKICGVTPPTVRRWVKENKIRAVRTATKRLLIPVPEIERILGKYEQP